MGPAADIQWRRKERKTREGEEEAQKQKEKARREEARKEEAKHTEEGVAEKWAKTDKSDTELDTCTDGGGEVGLSQLHSRHKKRHMRNI